MKFLLITILFLGGLPLLADDKSARPDIEELLVVKREQQLAEANIPAVKNMMAGIQSQTGQSSEVTAEINGLQNKIFTLIEQELSWNKMKSAYVKMYAEIYTPEQIQQLIAFYKSPVGQMMLDKQPLLQQKSMEMGQKRVAELMPALMKIADEDHKERERERDNPPKTDHRRVANKVLEDLRLLDSATDQYAIETNKVSGVHPTFGDLKYYLKSGTTLYNTGADPYGVPYGPFTVDSIPKVSPETFNALSDVADPQFWSPYK